MGGWMDKNVLMGGRCNPFLCSTTFPHLFTAINSPVPTQTPAVTPLCALLGRTGPRCSLWWWECDSQRRKPRYSTDNISSSQSATRWRREINSLHLLRKCALLDCKVVNLGRSESGTRRGWEGDETATRAMAERSEGEKKHYHKYSRANGRSILMSTLELFMFCNIYDRSKI